MKTYEVILTTDQTASAIVTVQAKSREAALEAAVMKANSENVVFETNESAVAIYYLGGGLDDDITEIEE